MHLRLQLQLDYQGDALAGAASFTIPNVRIIAKSGSERSGYVMPRRLVRIAAGSREGGSLIDLAFALAVACWRAFSGSGGGPHVRLFLANGEIPALEFYAFGFRGGEFDNGVLAGFEGFHWPDFV